MKGIHNTVLRKRRGYSLVELVVVLIIIGILAVAGISFGGKQIANARMQTISSNIQVVANDIEGAIVDLGFLTADELADQSARTNYFQEWDSKYLTSPLDISTMTFQAAGGDYDTFAGVSIRTSGYADPWGNELYLFYLAPTVEGEAYRIVLASAGPNSKWCWDLEATGELGSGTPDGYVNRGQDEDIADTDDDVFVVMIPRG